jgi:two-component system, chemotaxis family, chemotaxis protein CheY
MRILIADDSQAYSRQLTRLLLALGHEVVAQAQDGAAAVKLYEEVAPDLVFMDIVMPGMDGITGLRLIRSRDRHAQVIMLSSIAGVGGRVDEALKLGALCVLSKPAGQEELQRALEELADGKKHK